MQKLQRYMRLCIPPAIGELLLKRNQQEENILRLNWTVGAERLRRAAGSNKRLVVSSWQVVAHLLRTPEADGRSTVVVPRSPLGSLL